MKCTLLQEPKWFLSGHQLETVNSLDILGVSFSSDGKASCHVDKRVASAHRAMYGLSSIGMSYPGLTSDVKAHLWKSIGTPCLLYGLNSVHLSKSELQKLESTQGSTIKKSLGIGARSHHSKLLSALDIPPVKDLIKKETVSLLARVIKVESPYSKLCSYFLAKYITDGVRISNSLIDRIIQYDISPINVIFGNSAIQDACPSTPDGVVDSLRFLLMEENFVKPWSIEYSLVRLLTRAF